MKIKTLLLAALILGGRLTITGTAFASEHVASTLKTSESVQSSQTNQETGALRRLALALSAGNEAIRPLCGSQTEGGQKDRLKPSIPGWNAMWIVSLAMSHATAPREEAGNLFTRFVDELQSMLPSDRWRRIQEEPRLDSIRSYTYEDQESDAHIDLDLIARVDSYMVTIFGWTATDPRL